MRPDESFDEVAEILERLRVHDVSAERSARIHDRCIARLATRRRRRTRRVSVRLAAWGQWLEPAAALCLSAVYLAAATATAIRLWP